MVTEMDSRMVLPRDPDDTDVPVMFGDVGFVAYTEEGMVLLSTGPRPEGLIDDPFLSIASAIFGNIMLVSYGLVGVLDPFADEDEEAGVFPARVIVGVTREGFCASAVRRLDTQEGVIDEEGVVAGELRDVLIKIATG